VTWGICLERRSFAVLEDSTMNLRVATVNLMAPAGPFFAVGERVDALADALVRQSPDVLCTQEAIFESIGSLLRAFPEYEVLGRGRWANGTAFRMRFCIVRTDSVSKALAISGIRRHRRSLARSCP